ncbi:MAG: hypothetical protein ISR83_08100 [Candidatus Marinimicrobia bacterium]|nr:hypothetical protein [Candidatus Neomarinimicrobiota bacterium]
MNNFLLTSIGFLFIISGCVPNPYLLNNNPECLSTIEGFYHSPFVVKVEKPTLVLTNEPRAILHGEILEFNDQGVLFDQSKQGPFYDPEPTFYNIDDILTLVDGNKNILYGEQIPSLVTTTELILNIRRVNDLNAKGIRLEFKPNSQFGFCLKPGLYEVKNLVFKYYPTNNLDRGVDYPSLFIQVDGNTSNYIGDIYLNPPDSLGATIKIPYKILDRPEVSGVVGATGGAVGGLLLAVANELAGVIGTHTLSFRDNTIITKGISSNKTNLIQIQK